VLAYLPVNLLNDDGFSVDAFGERSGARVIDGAIYDPGREKILS
jgi:hypothetical protein